MIYQYFFREFSISKWVVLILVIHNVLSRLCLDSFSHCIIYLCDLEMNQLLVLIIQLYFLSFVNFFMNFIFLNLHTCLIILSRALDLFNYLRTLNLIKVLVNLLIFCHFIIQFTSKNQNFQLFYFASREVFCF